MSQSRHRVNGTIAALMTPLVMGLAPIFGKQAIHAGTDPFTLAMLRTCMAALILWIVYGLFFRKFIYIFPAGLLGTLVVGGLNGLGSLLYYNGLLLLDNASLVQLLNMLYVIFAMLLVRLYGQHISGLSIFRALLALIAVYLLAGGYRQATIHWIGVGLMIGSAFTYALHIVLSQRVMYEMPAQTMALYALTWMGLIVLIARLAYGTILPLRWGPAMPIGWIYVLGMMTVTALSRVTLFMGVRNLGSLQTILLNVAEIGVTLMVAFMWLGERMEVIQWFGVALLVVSALLTRWDSGIRDYVYHPIPMPSPLGGLPLPFQDPLTPNRFSVVTRLYRRRPSSQDDL
ncbi:MAG: DMT family transporter [Anaerolineae bacterium]|nr:DMT family transporter [Anaerolineae bacterium]